MKILLLNPPCRLWAKSNILPLGLGYIASVLRNEEHEVRVLDINAYRYSKAYVEGFICEADVDVYCIGGIITTYKYIKWLIRIIRKYHRNKRKIIVGGPIGSTIPETMLEHNDVNCIVMGEGEETIVELINCYSGEWIEKPIKGICFNLRQLQYCNCNEKRPPIENLDDIPFPAWDLFPMHIYLRNPIGYYNKAKWQNGVGEAGIPLTMNLSASRSCPFSCLFCSHDFIGYKYRHRSAENVAEEIEKLFILYGVTYFHFVDDEFMVDINFVNEFCDEMAYLRSYYKTNLEWGATGRVDIITRNEETVKYMGESGCRQICLGIESGSQKILDYYKKGVTVEQAKEGVRIAQRYIDDTDCSFMIGAEIEDTESIRDTIMFCKELNLKPEVVFFTTPYPGSELYNIAWEKGFIKEKNEENYILKLSDNEQGENIVCNMTKWDDSTLYKMQRYMITSLKAQNIMRHK